METIIKIEEMGNLKNIMINPFTLLEESYKLSKENFEKYEKNVNEANQKMKDYMESKEIKEMIEKYQPINVWKEYTNVLNKKFEETSNKEEYSKSMGDALNFFLKQQEVVQKMTDNYLKQYNIPTKKDIANVAELVVQLEEKIDTFNEIAEVQVENQKRIEAKLDRLLTSDGEKTESKTSKK